MHALSADDILRAWETGRQKHAVDRALMPLAVALPTLSLPQLRALTLGQRNIWLLSLRLQTFGAHAMCLVRCPVCSEQLEFSLDIETLLDSSNKVARELEAGDVPEAGRAESVHTLVVADFQLSFRLLNSVDLAVATQGVDAEIAYRRLIECCVVKAIHDEREAPVESLPEHILQSLAEAMLENDPLAEIALALDCSSCQHSWTALFDIATFFWTELDVLAKRLLRDVHAIAATYGWSESDILALSAARRQYYLELIR